MTARRKLSVIACPSLRPELESLTDGCSNEIAFQHLEMALHERSAAALHDALQAAIDQTTDCDAIAIAYGLCNRGVVGVRARNIPLVIPRAHDCIGILLGSSRRYLDVLEEEPGTFFQSAGWLNATRDERQAEFHFGPNSNTSFALLAARYGDEAAQYLIEQLEGLTGHYKHLAYIATPVGASPMYEAQARAVAEARGLQYRRLDGDTGWLRRLLDGTWSSREFLVVQPGQHIVLTSGDTLIEAA